MTRFFLVLFLFYTVVADRRPLPESIIRDGIISILRMYVDFTYSLL